MARTGRRGLINPNPALTGAFDGPSVRDGSGVMTLGGTLSRIGLLLVVLLAGGAVGWAMLPASLPVVLGLSLVGLVLAVVAMRNPARAKLFAPAYALVEGLVLGAISALYESLYSGIVPQAAALTVLVLVALLAVYRSGLIRVTQNFRLGVAAATGGVMLLYLVHALWRLFGGSGFSMISGNSVLGIGFSLLMAALAAANLVVDFDYIESAIERRMPADYEWVAAIGLLVSLVWLYLELLRLLAKLQSRE